MKPFTKAAGHSQSLGVSQTQRVIGLENPFSKGYKYCRDGRLTQCPGAGPEGTSTHSKSRAIGHNQHRADQMGPNRRTGARGTQIPEAEQHKWS